MIEDGATTVYFAGDTGDDPAMFSAIGRRFRIDVALLPVGPAGRAAWIERWRRKVHLTPERAMHAFALLGAQWMIPIHFGTFFRPRDAELPVIRAAIARDPRGDHVRLLGVGEATDFLW
jgi:L-ascorbate metabolism protein UlaG (beta-lactamase superfamily)